MLRNMRVVLAGLLLLLSLGCGNDGRDASEFRIYHLELAIGGPGDEGELRCGPPRIVCPGVVEQPPPRSFRYAVRADPAVTSTGIDPASARRSTDPETGDPLVVIDFTADGAVAFAQVTKEAARTGGRDQAWHHVAVIVGDEIVAFPQVDYDAFPDGIANAPSIHIVAASDADADRIVGLLRGT